MAEHLTHLNRSLAITLKINIKDHDGQVLQVVVQVVGGRGGQGRI